MKVRKATTKDLVQLSELFDGYRQFYQQKSNIDAATLFLQQRLMKGDSVIFVAATEDQRSVGKLLGFTQLYPSFSSVSLQRLWVLNDLFVGVDARKMGVAKALIDASFHWAQITDSKGLALETDSDNIKAQKLYAKLNFIKQDSTYHYFLPTQAINMDQSL